MRKPLLLATAIVMLMTACRAEANISLIVDEDGSGSVTVEFGVDDEMMNVITAMGGESPEELFDLIPDDEDVDTRVEGDMTFFSTTNPFSDVTELNEVLGDLDESDTEFGEVELSLDDGGAQLDVVLDVPDPTEAAGDLGTDLDFLEDVGISANFYADLPGSLEESNADQILSDGRLRWTIPTDGGRLEIHAVTSGDDEGAPIAMILGIVLVALLLIAAVAWSLRRRASSEGVIAATPAPPPPRPFDDEDGGEDG